MKNYHWTVQQHVAIQVLSGRSSKSLARNFDLSERTVSDWGQEFHGAAVDDMGNTAAENAQATLKGLRSWSTPFAPVTSAIRSTSLSTSSTRYSLPMELLEEWVLNYHTAGMRTMSEASENRPNGSVALLAAHLKRHPSHVLMAGKRDLLRLAADTALKEIEARSLLNEYREAGNAAVIQMQRELLQSYINVGTDAFRKKYSGSAGALHAVVEAVSGRPIATVASESGIHDDVLTNWKDQFMKAGRSALGKEGEKYEPVVLQLLSEQKELTSDEPLDRADWKAGIRWQGPYKNMLEQRAAVAALEAREKFFQAGVDALTRRCGRLFIFSGPPTSGKTMLINMIKETPTLRPVIVPKYATRQWRGLNDDTQYHEELDDSEFDFIYPYHNNRYGVRASDIGEILASGSNAFLVISPPRVIRAIKQYFGPLAISVYIHSNRAESELVRIVEERARQAGQSNREMPEALEKEVRRRIINMHVMRRQYVDNIALYDHVLLNTSSRKLLLGQIKNIVQLYDRHFDRPARRVFGSNVLFLLCAPPSSGKRTLSEALRLMGARVVSNVIKTTDRAPRENDGDEISAIGKWIDRGDERPSEERGIINDKVFDLTYLWNENRYALQSSSIWEDLSRRRAQLLVTNMQAIPRYRRLFGPTIAPMYLYTTRTEAEIRDYLRTEKRLGPDQVSQRLKKIEKVYRDYVKNIGDFHHVLLNTGDPDDLIDQMFNILSLYSLSH